MNVNKAREYFSAHYEGSLDRGLKQSFEHALNQDAQLQAEYKAFQRTMTELDGLSAITVEPPEDLHERISARLDRVAWEAKQAKPTGIRAWWRLAVLGTAATAVLALAFLQSSAPTGPKTIASGMVVPTVSPDAFDFTPISGGVSLNVPTGKGTVVFLDQTGKELERRNLETDGILNKVLGNSGQDAHLVGIQLDTKPALWLAIPGKGQKQFDAGTGTLKEFAVAVSKGFGIPVIVSCDNSEAQVTWEEQAEVMSLASKAVEKHSLKVELRKAGGGDILFVQQN